MDLGLCLGGGACLSGSGSCLGGGACLSGSGSVSRWWGWSEWIWVCV